MTVEEALRELGVDAAAGREEIRRAYLRLIKTRKPESDPDGFQRARQAYEVARPEGDLETLAVDSEQRYGTQAPATSEPPAGAGVRDAPLSATGGAPSREAVFAGFVTAWHAVPRSADPGLRIEIAREAVAVLPAEPRAHWLLVRSLSGTTSDAALAEALRAGWKAGWPEFLEALLLRLPGRASREEVQAALDADKPSLRLAAAAVAALYGDATVAAQVVIDACAVAAQARLPHGGDVPVGRMLEVILALHQVGAVEAASQAHAALATYLHDSGQELVLTSGPLSGIWTLAGELAQLPPDFPAGLRRAFAAATRAGDLETAVVDATGQARRHRRLVAKWTERVRATSPNIASALTAALARAKVRRSSFRPSFQSSFRFIPSRWAWLVVLACSSLARIWCAESPGPQRPAKHIVEPRGPATSGQGQDRPPVNKAALQMAEEAATQLCGAAGARHGQLVCGTVDGLLAAVVDGNCSATANQLEDIERVLGPKPANRLEARVLTRLHVIAWQACGEQKPIVLPEPTR